MTLEDLLVQKLYRAKKIGGKMVAFEDTDGNYKATSADDVERALTDKSQRHTVYVTTSYYRKWYKLPKS